MVTGDQAAIRPPMYITRVMIICAAFWSSSAWANFVWPPMLYMYALSTWWAIVSGLILECLIFHYFTKSSLKASFYLACVVNAVSTLAGVCFVSLLKALSFRESHEATSVTVIIVMAFFPLFVLPLNIFIEHWAAKRLLKLPKQYRRLKMFVVANSCSVLLIMMQIIYFTISSIPHAPDEYRPSIQSETNR